MIVLLASCAAGQSKPSTQPRNRSNDDARVTAEETQRSLRAIAAELRALREQTTKADSERTKQTPEQNGGWRFGNDAPVWSNWILASIALFAGFVATRAFNHERDAVFATQRADLLFFETALEPRTKPSRLTGDTTLGLIFKNFGPTRASQVKMIIDMEIEGFSQLTPAPGSVLDENPDLPRTVVGAGDTVVASFARLGRLYSLEAISLASKGDRKLQYIATVEYVDVFGKPHHTTCKGVYYGPISGFVVLENNDAN
jgi:hypothetical protein